VLSPSFGRGLCGEEMVEGVEGELCENCGRCNDAFVFETVAIGGGGGSGGVIDVGLMVGCVGSSNVLWAGSM
jgi:hypothetical protein